MNRKRISLPALLAAAASIAIGVSADPVDEFLARFLTSCASEMSLSTQPAEFPLPEGWTARLLEITSDDPYCAGQQLEVRAGNRIYVGYPWILAGYEGPPSRRIEQFSWERLQQPVQAQVGAVDSRGMKEATVVQTTDWGRIPLEGWVDPRDSAFFPGDFFSLGENPEQIRMDRLAPALSRAPRKGDPAAAVTVVEFSDFQCPSCKRTSAFVETIVEKYGSRISYQRVDFPLYHGHPWALPAALMGRAIHRQSPEAFWTFKKAVYENQSELNTFTIGDFARGIAKDFELDLDRYDSDLQSEDLRMEIVNGISIATGLQVFATPTFWVNGRPVSAGEDGAHLDAFIGGLLQK